MRILPSKNKSQGRASTLLAVRLANTDDVVFYNVGTWTIANTFTTLSCGNSYDGSGESLEISPDNSFFIAGGSLGTGAYSMSDGSELYFVPAASGQAYAVGAVSKDSRHIVIQWDRNSFYIVETAGWTITRTMTNLGVSNYINDAVWSHDGTKIAFSGQGVRIYNSNNGTAWSTYLTTSTSSYIVDFSHDDSLISISNRNDNGANSVEVMDVETNLTRKSAFSVDLVGEYSLDAKFTSDRKYLIGASNSTLAGAIEKWDVATWTSQATSLVNGVTTNRLAISNDDTYVACVGSGSPYLEIRDTSDLTEITGTPTLASSCVRVAWNHP